MISHHQAQSTCTGKLNNILQLCFISMIETFNKYEYTYDIKDIKLTKYVKSVIWSYKLLTVLKRVIRYTSVDLKVLEATFKYSSRVFEVVESDKNLWLASVLYFNTRYVFLSPVVMMCLRLYNDETSWNFIAMWQDLINVKNKQTTSKRSKLVTGINREEALRNKYNHNL